jgi:hypothetical protein
MQEQAGEIMGNYLKSNTTLLMLDVAFNDFNFKNINDIESRIKENQKAFKAAAVGRYKKGIDFFSDKIDS